MELVMSLANVASHFCASSAKCDSLKLLRELATALVMVGIALTISTGNGPRVLSFSEMSSLTRACPNFCVNGSDFN